MKSFASRLVLLSACSLVASVGFAQSPKAQRARSQRAPATVTEESAPAVTSRERVRTNDTWSWMKERSTVGGFISSASDLSVEGAALNVPQGNQTFRGAGSMSTESALGLTAQLVEMKSANWGWFAGASIEQSRQISSGNLNLGQVRLQGPFTNKPRFLPVIVSGGAVYRFNPQIYLSGGVNYTIYKDFGGGDIGGASLTPKFGYQYGAGVKLFPRVSIEIMNRDVRYSLDGNLNGNKLTLDDVRLVGMNIIGRYDLE